MEPNKHELCSICNEKLSCPERMIDSEIMNLLKFILLNVNCKLLQDSLLCQTCLSKIDCAYKFKASYLDLSQKASSSIVKEEPDSESCIRCEICKSPVSSDACIPLFNSISKSDVSLINYFSPQVELETYENFLSCESCHKSLINFYDITNLLSIFNDDHVDQISSRDDVNIKEESQLSEDVYNEIVDETFRTDSEEEMNDTLEDVKEEIEIEEGHLKIEESNIKIDNGEESVEIKRIGQQKVQRQKFNSIFLDHKISHEIELMKCQNCTFETKHKNYFKWHMVKHKDYGDVEILKCHICTYKTKHKSNLNRHMLLHKNSEEVELFKCQICTYETKYKSVLKRHMLIHNSGEVEIFKCEICEREMKHKSYFIQHMLLHKNSNEVENYKCHNCEFKTKHKGSLRRHMLLHKNSEEINVFKCQICTYKTNYKNNLRTHILIHNKSNEVKIYKCHNCEFKTKYKASIRRHNMLLHKNSEEIC